MLLICILGIRIRTATLLQKQCIFKFIRQMCLVPAEFRIVAMGRYSARQSTALMTWLTQSLQREQQRLGKYRWRLAAASLPPNPSISTVDAGFAIWAAT